MTQPQEQTVLEDLTELDKVEQYDGAWTICYMLDDGTCHYSVNAPFDSKDDALRHLVNLRRRAVTANKEGKFVVHNSRKYGRNVCNFNLSSFKKKARQRHPNIPHCITAFPIPMKG